MASVKEAVKHVANAVAIARTTAEGAVVTTVAYFATGEDKRIALLGALGTLGVLALEHARRERHGEATRADFYLRMPLRRNTEKNLRLQFPIGRR